MARRATSVSLLPEEEQLLRHWTKAGAHQIRMAERATIVLMAAEGKTTQQIATALGVRPARVSKWRKRFATHGLAGLETAERSGKPRRYDESVDSRILWLIRQLPPEPHSVWTGPLLAQAVGDVSLDHVWRVLRTHGITLRKRDTWEYETQTHVVFNLLSLIGIYLSHDVSGFLVGIVDPKATSPGDRLRTYWRAPSPQLAEHLQRHFSGPSRLSLLETLRWATQRETGLLETPPRSRPIEEFVRDAIENSGAREIHVFAVGALSRMPPVVRSHIVPTLEAWSSQLVSWIAASLPASQTDYQVVTGLVGAYLATQNIPFEWCAWQRSQSAAPRT
jgi:transposase